MTRFQGRGTYRRGWAVVAIWTGDVAVSAAPDRIKAATTEAIYRFAYQRLHGEPRLLRHRLVQEGLAARGKSPAAFERRCIRAGPLRSALLFRANGAAIPPSKRLASPAPPRSRCNAGFHHGLLVASFGDDPEHQLSAGQLADVAPVLRRHLESQHFPTVFACLYGDTAARQAGYNPLGLPPWAGFAFAARAVEEAGVDPVSAL